MDFEEVSWSFRLYVSDSWIPLIPCISINASYLILWSENIPGRSLSSLVTTSCTVELPELSVGSEGLSSFSSCLWEGHCNSEVGFHFLMLRCVLRRWILALIGFFKRRVSLVCTSGDNHVDGEDFKVHKRLPGVTRWASNVMLRLAV